MKLYLESIDAVCADAKSSVDGITSQEAESRLEANGKNKLAEGKKEPIILRFLKQFIEPMTLILIVAAIISGILTAVNNSSGGKKEFPSRAYVGQFNFKGGDQQKKVGQLSGGERNRVHLAKMLRKGANVILLDEPTNDLDVDTLR